MANILPLLQDDCRAEIQAALSQKLDFLGRIKSKSLFDTSQALEGKCDIKDFGIYRLSCMSCLSYIG